MRKPTTCPRCHVLCTIGELRSAIHPQTRPMIASHDPNVPLRNYIDGAILRLGEKVVWPITESRKVVCDACMEEIRRGARAHRTYSGKGWRST